MRSTILSSADSTIEVTLLDVGPAARPDAGDLNVAIRVRHAGISECNDNVWLEGDAWAAFVAQLRALVANRHGSALLCSMSPKEFRLEIRGIDDTTFIVQGHVGRYGYGRSDAPDVVFPYQLHVTVETLSTWSELADQFRTDR